MTLNASPPTPTDVDLLRRIDAACDQFETAWRCGRQPRIEDYLVLFKAAERLDAVRPLPELQQELVLAGLAKIEPRPFEPAARSAPTVADLAPPVLEFSEADATLMAEGGAVRLRVTGGPNAGEECLYAQHDTLMVGRSPRARLRRRGDRAVSRHHFRREINALTGFLMDLGSSNGTFVNGRRVTERYLDDGDVLSVGETQLAVTILPSIDSVVAPRPSARPLAAPPRRIVAPAQPNAAPPNESSDAVAEGVTIPGYRVHERIGAGGLGTVYRGTRLATGETCAVKVLRSSGDERAAQTFLREAAVLNRLSHPHVVRLVEMGAAEAGPYLSTEFVAAVPWESLVERFSPAMRVRTACGLIAQALGALDHAHGLGLVHRDVKPGNMLIERSGGRLRAKLADFGLAKRFADAGMSQVTRNGDVLGSLAFMSPEQFIS